MSDSTTIDQAIIDRLNNDNGLMAMMPHGAHWDEAPAGATRFVIVSLVTAFDEPMLGARAFEDVTYLVKAVGLSSLSPNMRGAAERIDALLDFFQLTLAGYSLMIMRRIERVRLTEVDDTDPSIRWQHRGGRFQVVASS